MNGVTGRDWVFGSKSWVLLAAAPRQATLALGTTSWGLERSGWATFGAAMGPWGEHADLRPTWPGLGKYHYPWASRQDENGVSLIAMQKQTHTAVPWKGPKVQRWTLLTATKHPGAISMSSSSTSYSSPVCVYRKLPKRKGKVPNCGENMPHPGAACSMQPPQRASLGDAGRVLPPNSLRGGCM